MGFFPPVCWVQHGQWGWSQDREQHAWEGRRCSGSTRLAGQPGIEALTLLRGCGPTVCSDLSAVSSLPELLLRRLPGICPDPSCSLALFKKRLSLSALENLNLANHASVAAAWVAGMWRSSSTHRVLGGVGPP